MGSEREIRIDIWIGNRDEGLRARGWLRGAEQSRADAHEDAEADSEDALCGASQLSAALGIEQRAGRERASEQLLLEARARPARGVPTLLFDYNILVRASVLYSDSDSGSDSDSKVQSTMA